MRNTRIVRYLAATCFVAVSIGCAGSSGTAADAPPPKLASYDQSCAVDSDCALVSAEGCVPCDTAALSAKDAPKYSAAQQEAQKTPTCQRQAERAGACSLRAAVVARCQTARCVVAAAPISDAGGDAPSDAPSD